MNTKKRFIDLAVSLVVVAFGVLSCVAAGETGIHLMATKMQPGTSGTSSVGDKSLSIRAKGLKPNAVYTVWFVNATIV